MKITFPLNNGQAGPTQLITGTARSISSGQTLWIVVYIPSVGRWYPQAPLVTVGSDGSWTYRPGIGSGNDDGKTFLLQAVIADTNANNAINDYINTGRSAGAFPGLTALPVGALVADQVSVTRVPVDVATPTPLPHPSQSEIPSTMPSSTSSATASATLPTSSTTGVTGTRQNTGVPGFEGEYALIALVAAFMLAHTVSRRR